MNMRNATNIMTSGRHIDAQSTLKYSIDEGFTKLGITPGGGSIAPTNVCRPTMSHVSWAFMIRRCQEEVSWIWIDSFKLSQMKIRGIRDEDSKIPPVLSSYLTP